MLDELPNAEPPRDAARPAPDADTPEVRERQAAWRRGEARERQRATTHSVEPARSMGLHRERAAAAACAFAALAENVRDYAIFLMDPDGVITFWGEGARLIKWWTKEQAEGAHLRLLYPPGGSEDGTAEDHLRDSMERGEYTGEGTRVRSDGSTFWAGVTLTALRDDDGSLLGFAKVTRDLTARRAADALLQSAASASEAARAAAEAANRAKSGFLATMSHEIRTPVNAILGYHELLELETDGPLTPGQRRHLARASAGGRHLLALITEVLDFSRIEAERVEIGRTAFRVGDAVSAALALVAPDAHARGLEVTDAVSGHSAGLAAWGDEARVRQILVNILSNAIKFTDAGQHGGGRVTVSVGMSAQPSPDTRLSGGGPWVYLRVEDTGRGIPADRLESIFEPFVQVDMTLTRRHGGTGLGLAISRRLARLMGGDVTARSEVGMGSAFFLWLPAAPVESIQTGGFEGNGPHTDPSPPAQHGAMPPEGRQPMGALGEISDALIAELERVLHAYVARLRSDPATPSAHHVAEAEIEDHLASFLADIAASLASLDAAGGSMGPEVTRDSSEIQRVVAERHGAQRARLGWNEQEIHREFTVLREEMAAAVRRRAPGHLRGPNVEARQGEADRALELLEQFLAVAERVSVASHRRTLDDGRPAAARAGDGGAPPGGAA